MKVGFFFAAHPAYPVYRWMYVAVEHNWQFQLYDAGTGFTFPSPRLCGTRRGINLDYAGKFPANWHGHRLTMDVAGSGIGNFTAHLKSLSLFNNQPETPSLSQFNAGQFFWAKGVMSSGFKHECTLTAIPPTQVVRIAIVGTERADKWAKRLITGIE